MKKDSQLAPIVLFVYNRLWHTQQTIESLRQNTLSSQSQLYVYSDGPKGIQDKVKVREVREYLNGIDGLGEVTIILREKNWGLADNIIDGVTQVVNEHGKVIVIEDDLVTSTRFLEFMNLCLDEFADVKRIWHISGWNYPIDAQGLPDIFLWRVMNCWGWATWADRWQFYKRDPKKLITGFSRQDIRRFNLDGRFDFWRQVIENSAGIIKTWAIFWYATIFEKDGLCVNPSRTLVHNIGQDGSGTHCGKAPMQVGSLSRQLPQVRQPALEENVEAVKRIAHHLQSMKPSFLRRCKFTIRSMIVRCRSFI